MNDKTHDKNQCAAGAGGQSTDEMIALIRAKALAGEFQVIVMSGDGEEYPFAYTVGLSLVGPGFPELISIGRGTQMMHYTTVNEIGQYWCSLIDRSESGVVAENIIRIYPDLLEPYNGKTMPLEVREMDTPSQWGIRDRYMRMLTAALPEHTHVQVAQVLFPDPNGLLPYQEGYDHLNWPQPKLEVQVH